MIKRGKLTKKLFMNLQSGTYIMSNVFLKKDVSVYPMSARSLKHDSGRERSRPIIEFKPKLKENSKLLTIQKAVIRCKLKRKIQL